VNVGDGQAVPSGTDEKRAVDSSTRVRYGGRGGRRGGWRRPYGRQPFGNGPRGGQRAAAQDSNHARTDAEGQNDGGHDVQAGSEQVETESRTVQLPQEELSPEQLFELRETEVRQLLKRFTKAEKVDAEGTTFNFVFTPSDPDWPFDVRHLDLQVCFPMDYPSVAPSIITRNPEDVLPKLLVEDLDAAIKEWIVFFHKAGQLTFRPFLRWIDRNLQGIFVESLRRLKRFQEQPTVVVFEQGTSSSVQKSDSASSEGEADDSVAIDLNLPIRALPKRQERLQELDDLFNAPNKPRIEVTKGPHQAAASGNQLAKILNNYDPHSGPRKGIEIKFRHVDLSESLTFIICDRLLVSVQCKKCKKIADFQLLPARRAVTHCAKCQSKLEACFRPGILLQFNPVLGYLELQDCTIRDVALPRCHFYGDCQSCSKLSPIEGVHLGQRVSARCLNCNLKMQLVLDSLKYMDMCSMEASIKASQLRKANKDSAIQAGKPLPSNGACKHYKKSFRWFRFPCCAKAYPCDDCHNETEDHDAEFASRMICGFCAKEQPFSNDKPCSQCSNLITGRRTAYWEGGKGCRNKIRMNTGDAKKYTGINKTVSRKSAAKTK